MTSPLHRWYQKQLELPHPEGALAGLLGSVFASLYKALRPEAQPSDPQEALRAAYEWANAEPAFPAQWKGWLQWAQMSPERLLEQSSALLDFCENRDEALIQLRALPPPPKKNLPEDLRDYRGVPCPRNAMLARLEMARQPSQGILRFYLDMGSPIENVPGSLLADGHQLLSRRRLGDFWEITVKRGA